MAEWPVEFILSYSSYYGRTFEDFIRLAHERGFRAAQLTPDQAPNLYSEFPPGRRKSLQRLAEDLGIAVHLHNVFYDINPVSLVPEVRDMALRVTEQMFDLAVDVAAKSVTVHPGYMFGGWRRDEVQRERFWREAAWPLARLGEIARDRHVRLLLENGSYFITTATGFRPRPLHIGIEPGELRLIVEMCGENACVALDINKAIHSDVAPVAFVEAFGPRIGQLQVSTAEKYREEIAAVMKALDRGKTHLEFVFEGSREEGENAAAVISELVR